MGTGARALIEALVNVRSRIEVRIMVLHGEEREERRGGYGRVKIAWEASAEDDDGGGYLNTRYTRIRRRYSTNIIRKYVKFILKIENLKRLKNDNYWLK